MERLEMESEYIRYLSGRMDQQDRLDRYISECVILSETTTNSCKITKIAALNETVGSAIKDMWTKFKTFISKIWNKFMEQITKMCAQDQTYLNKYKDIIIKNKLKFEFTVTGNYMVGISRLVNHPV